MRPTRLILIFPLSLALVMALAACGGDDAPTDEEYFRKMDEVDKEVDIQFENINCEETTTAKECAAAFANGVSFAEPLYDDVKPSDDAKDEHEELVAAIKELRERLESAEGDFTDEDTADAFFESDAFDTTRADGAFCAIQDLADAKNIEADVGCENGETVDPATLEPVETTDVLIEGFAFDPPHIQVTVGDTVTFTQGADTEPHTATADDDSFDTDVLADEGEAADITFDEAGVFPYFCEIHPEMLGQVTVVE
jgi:plastocyanin